MEYTRCDTCGSDRPVVRKDLSDSLSLQAPYTIVQCAECGFRYMNPRLTALEYRDFYAGTEYLKQYGYQDLLSGSRVPEFQRTLKKISAVKKPSGSLLDIGCATGEFLIEAKQSGWKVFGTEISDTSVKVAKEKFGLDIFHGELHEANFPPHSFEVIHLSHVLEHVPSPQDTLKTISELLAPNGLLVIEVPNEFDNWFLRLGKILGRYRPPQRPSMHHVSFFSRKSLAKSLQRAGYSSTISTYSPQLPIAHPPAAIKFLITFITRIVDRSGGGIHIQAFARRD